MRATKPAVSPGRDGQRASSIHRRYDPILADQCPEGHREFRDGDHIGRSLLLATCSYQMLEIAG